MHGYSHDFDLFKAWAELVVLDRFELPQRRVRQRDGVPARTGQGAGARGPGVDELQQVLGHLVVEVTVAAEPGQPAASDYLGEGFVMVRDADTDVVREALRRIIGGVRVELAEAL